MDTILNNYKNLLEIEFHILKERNIYIEKEEKKLTVNPVNNDKNPVEYNMYISRRKKDLYKKDELKKFKNSNENEYSVNDFMTSEIIKYDNDDVEINKINIDELNYEKKKEKIDEYMSRKNIYLDSDEYNKLQDILKDDNFKLNNYIKVSSVFGDITKVYFITKIKESNIYIIDTSINKNTKLTSSKNSKKKIIFKSMN